MFSKISGVRQRRYWKSFSRLQVTFLSFLVPILCPAQRQLGTEDILHWCATADEEYPSVPPTLHGGLETCCYIGAWKTKPMTINHGRMDTDFLASQLTLASEIKHMNEMISGASSSFLAFYLCGMRDWSTASLFFSFTLL